MEMLQLGPAGGTGGKPFAQYIIPAGARVSSVHIYTDWVIDALRFDYAAADDAPGSLPPIGGLGGAHHAFELEPDEYLTGISGRYGWYVDAVRFQTNKRESPFFGGEGGIHEFEFKAPAGYEIVGLFGRAAWYIDALGVIVRPVAMREEIVEGLAIAAEAEAELTAEQAEVALDDIVLEIVAEIEAEMAAHKYAGAELAGADAAELAVDIEGMFGEAVDPEIVAAAEAAVLAEVVAALTDEVEAELQAGEQEALLAAALEDVEGGEIEEEAWLSVGVSEPIDAVVTIRRDVVADQAALEELEDAVIAEAIAGYGGPAVSETGEAAEGAVDITLYTQVVEDETTGEAVATVMAVASDVGRQEATGDQPDEAAVMVTDTIDSEADIQEMEDEAVDGAINALLEDNGMVTDDVDVTIYAAIGNDARTGEAYAAVVAIAAEVEPVPAKKKSRQAAGHKSPQPIAAAEAAASRPADLQIIEGIGPKIADLLIANGVRNLADLSRAPVERLREILAGGGTRFNRADPGTWPEQAALADRADWDGLKAYQARLKGGRPG